MLLVTASRAAVPDPNADVEFRLRRPGETKFILRWRRLEMPTEA